MRTLLLLILAAASGAFAQRVRTGDDVLFDRFIDSLSGKKVGIVCNQTSVLPNGVHLVDTLLRRGVNVTLLFAPEHGIRGTYAAGEKVPDDVDSATHLPVVSLHGGSRKPPPESLARIDVLLFDLQDAGARFYTYGTTMAYCMEAAAEQGKKFVLLDRPNPIGGTAMEGPVLDLRLISFLSYFPIPVRHGLTLGELAKMTAGEGYINPSNVDLTVIPMTGWKRSMWYDQTGLRWIAPSPNMKSPATATVYPGTCLFESTSLSEGRGTPKPFELIGAPGIDGEKVAAALNGMKLPGVRFAPATFVPKGDAAAGVKHAGKSCGGVRIEVTDRAKFRPVTTGLMMVKVFLQIYPRKTRLVQGRFDHLIGDTLVGEKLLAGKLDTGTLRLFDSQMETYRKIRAKYLLYK